ncbi:Di-/tripeptide transporter [termite gut metagenome]|uniref:Di-/tripeptide transporter n=1 Tax=termite gut metagenome TaxID=433724 RepID=A0A5J4S7Q7_9ZZZZ
MFKKHPKGLLAAALANMGERFGFYTMMAILVLFLQAKFGLNGTNAGLIYSVFYFSIYILAFVGGVIADKTRNYKGTIFAGLVLMALGYLILAIPSPTPVSNTKLFLTISCIGLFVIAFGNGLFKGNLQALVGQMYDNDTYGSMRDSGFSLFYMFINIGAIFAPMAAVGIRNWWLGIHGFTYNADLPTLCHGQLAGTLTFEATETFNRLADEVSNVPPVANYSAFASDYLNVFTTGYHYAFAIAILAMGISLIIYLCNKKRFPDPSEKSVTKSNSKTIVEMEAGEIRQRLYALIAVFGIVIFFWFSFHQNGLTLTFFAKEYTNLSLFGKDITVELFQSLNPLFVVCLTPVVMGLFGWQRARGKEPSTPKKIAIGMGIAATAYVVMAAGSYFSKLPLHQDVLALGSSPIKVTPLLLIVTYLILTFAELYISPLGISFVSKVAPPKYQGVMQGGWLGATAIGNQLLFLGAVLYESIPVWMTWMVFVVACSISMITVFFMLKWLEKVAK